MKAIIFYMMLMAIIGMCIWIKVKLLRDDEAGQKPGIAS
jgi:hypothetical protein